MSPRSPRHGFTLIELLIVITILGLLAVALLPQITGVLGQGAQAATTARILHLQNMVESFSNKTGDFPPSEFSRAMPGVQAKADSINQGIECLLLHLASKRLGQSLTLDDKQDWFADTDGDKQQEIVDGWGTPFAYFHNVSYERNQTVRTSAVDDDQGSDVTVKAMRGDSGVLNPQKFQIISAGEDAEFNTDDDVSYPQRTVK